MRRLFSVLFVLCFAVGIMTSCGESTETASNGSTASSAVSTSVLSTEKVNFLDSNGESVYRVVRPNNSETTALAAKVFKSLKDTLKTNVKNVLDSEDGTDVYEIVIGNADRSEVEVAKDYLEQNTGARYNDWIICTVGKKIIIYSQSIEQLENACDYFCKNFIKTQGIEGGICYLKKTEGEFTDILINGENIRKFKFVRPHYNFSYLAQVEVDKIVASVFEKTGYMLEIAEDQYVAEGEYEIVVGNTNRSGVQKFDDYDHFNILISGNKLYLNGGNTYSTAMAVSEFAKMLQDGAVSDADAIELSSFKDTYAASYDPATTYYPVWIDDFDGDAVDTTKWDVCNEEYTHRDETTGTTGKNGLGAWRKPENVLIYDGYFHAVGTRDEKGYYGGTIRSNNHMNFKYGYVETSCLLPQGSGFWNTLWMSSVTSNGIIGPEIDVNESFGNSAVADANAHVWPRAGAAEYGWEHRSFDTIRANESKFSLPEGDKGTLKDAFHTYGFLWTEDYIAFTGDGKIYCDLDLNEEGFEDYKLAYTTVRVKMILSGTPGFSNCPLPQTATDEEWEKSSTYISDYVHLYQLTGDGSELYIDGQPAK